MFCSELSQGSSPGSMTFPLTKIRSKMERQGKRINIHEMLLAHVLQLRFNIMTSSISFNWTQFYTFLIIWRHFLVTVDRLWRLGGPTEWRLASSDLLSDAGSALAVCSCIGWRFSNCYCFLLKYCVILRNSAWWRPLISLRILWRKHNTCAFIGIFSILTPKGYLLICTLL